MSTTRRDAAGTLERFVADALIREGAVVEPWAHGLDVVLAPALATELRVGEYERLTFDAAPAGAGALPLDYDAPIVEALGMRLSRSAAVASAGHGGATPRPIDAEAVLSTSLTTRNGIARLLAAEIRLAAHVGVVVQYDVLADERASGLVEVWVSPATRSVTTGLGHAWDRASTGDADGATAADAGRVAGLVTEAWPIVQAACRHAVRADVEPFLASLARRRDRDLERVRQYYRDIHDEIARKAARHRGEARAREEARIQATLRAFAARMDDVVARCRARVTLTPVAALVAYTTVWHLRVRLQRRTAAREVTFLCEGRGKRLEPRACDHCQAPTLSASLCDDRVHYLCGECLAPCAACGRSFCRACSPRCPRAHAGRSSASTGGNRPLRASSSSAVPHAT